VSRRRNGRARPISVSLDPAVPFEALVFQRLHGLPVDRRDEWLRNLLVQGFLAECAALRALEAPTAMSPSAPVPRPAARSRLAPIPAIDTERPATPVEPPIADDDTPTSFAALRRVIGA
jgi:hypothetical protein